MVAADEENLGGVAQVATEHLVKVAQVAAVSRPRHREQIGFVAHRLEVAYLEYKGQRSTGALCALLQLLDQLGVMPVNVSGGGKEKRLDQ